MDGQATAGLLRHFLDLPDPRAVNVIHKFVDILTLAICAVICGADGWVEVRLIAFDGKAIRRSFEHAWDKSGMVHLVSAFSRDNQMVFGQVAVADKSNEITAIPQLLDLLDLKQ